MIGGYFGVAFCPISQCIGMGAWFSGLPHRGDADVADVLVFLELTLEVTLLHVVECDDTYVGIATVPSEGRPSMLNHQGHLAWVGVALAARHKIHDVDKREAREGYCTQSTSPYFRSECSTQECTAHFDGNLLTEKHR